MIRKLRIKFICVNMAIVTAMLLVIFGMVLRFTSDSLEQQSLDMLQTVAEERKPILSWDRPRENQPALPYFSVSVNLWGEVTATAGGFYDLSNTETVEEVLRLALVSQEEMGYLKTYRLRFQRVNRPFGQTVVFVDVSSQLDTLESLAKSCLAIGFLSLAVFFGLSVLLARWAIRPVETAWNQQRQFVADASHELKTPLTVILTNAELLQSPEYDETQKVQFISSILTMSAQMRGLVESLLELARVDNGTAKMAFSQSDFSALIQDALLPFEPVYFEKGLGLESEIAPEIQVQGSETHLRQVVEILLDNATKYSTPGGTVLVRLQRKGHQCLLSVANPGPAITREDLKNIFKRFYRVDKARTMNHSYGLGLSIAQTIVQQHGGKIWAESSQGINTFFVQLNSIPQGKMEGIV